jgi:large subunit ribosomal protein L3
VKTKQKLGEVMEQNTQTQANAKTATLSSGLGGILGVKAGMTQVYSEDGRALAVTVVEIKTNTVTQVKKSDKHGYSAVQVGFLPKKESRVNSAEKGHFKKSGTPGFYHAQEFRFAKDEAIETLSEGMTLTPDFIKAGDLIDVSAVSKGKGFQGVMKRYHYAGGYKSHGASVSHRQIGSIGNRADPGKVFKGKKMAGHMGHKKVSIQNLKVVRVDMEKGIVLVHGSVPGPISGIVTIRKAVKAEV